MISKAIIATFFCLTFLAIKGAALRCYDCAGPLSKGVACENDVQSVQKSDCYSSEVCVNFTINSYYVSVITRGCARSDICTVLNNEHNSAYDKLTFCATCDTDLCNSSNQKIPSHLIALVAVFCLKYFM